MLKNKLIAGAIFALALTVAVSASAADFGTTVLKVGSRGAAVTALQNALGVSPATGYFGSITKAKVMAFQTNNGLKADGVVGAATKAALNSSSPVATTGCPAGAAFNPSTGAPCTTPTTSTVPGCTVGAAFSATTGQACTGGTTTPSTGVLTGGAGSIDGVNPFTAGVDSQVKEGRNTNVLGVEIKASNDSDLAIKTLSLDLTHVKTGSTTIYGSDRLDRYVDAVDVYNGSTKVGSASATDFSRSGVDSSKTINLSDVIVKAGQKVRLTVVFEAKDTIQSSTTAGSNDQNATWTVEATSIRYQDATGVILSKDITNVSANVTFESSTALDTISLQSSSLNPSNTNVQVKANSSSDDVLVGAFKLKAGSDSSELDVTSIPVNLTLTSGAVAGNVISDIYLKVDGTIYDNYTASGTTGATPTYTFSIDSGDLVIPAASSKEVQIFVTFGSQSGKYTSGTQVTPAITGGTISVENSAGDTVTSPSSAFAGSTFTLLVNGASVTYVSDSFTPVDNSGSGTPINGTIGITFQVSNFGDNDVKILENQVVNNTTLGTAGDGTIDNTLSGATAAADTTALVTSSQVTKQGNGTSIPYFFIVSPGSTKTFTLSEKFSAQSGFAILSITSVDGTVVSNVQTAAH